MDKSLSKKKILNCAIFKWDNTTAKAHNLVLRTKETDFFFSFCSFLILCHIKKILLLTKVNPPHLIALPGFWLSRK